MGLREIESKIISKFCAQKSDIEVYLPRAWYNVGLLLFRIMKMIDFVQWDLSLLNPCPIRSFDQRRLRPCWVHIPVGRSRNHRCGNRSSQTGKSLQRVVAAHDCCCHRLPQMPPMDDQWHAHVQWSIEVCSAIGRSSVRKDSDRGDSVVPC